MTGTLKKMLLIAFSSVVIATPIIYSSIMEGHYEKNRFAQTLQRHKQATTPAVTQRNRISSSQTPTHSPINHAQTLHTRHQAWLLITGSVVITSTGVLLIDRIRKYRKPITN
ncbi:MAG: hypothetical protein H9901_03055 [Candidatus Paralactobacillus gallistercoris]|uniref:Uncharacterized protein n=1 Tax=Candidatus Paralactobacillus gallistercoris TaxID=2838724 RepID=A0A948X0M7_9LACO|nr:hypothetical protein [Candidatus Paralactobacillus gallistercoris]